MKISELTKFVPITARLVAAQSCNLAIQQTLRDGGGFSMNGVAFVGTDAVMCYRALQVAMQEIEQGCVNALVDLGVERDAEPEGS